MNAIVAPDKTSPIRRQTRNTTASSIYSGIQTHKQPNSIVNLRGQANSRVPSLTPLSNSEQTDGVHVFSSPNGSYGTLSADSAKDCDLETYEKSAEEVSPYRTQRNGQDESLSEDTIVLTNSGKAESSSVIQNSHQPEDELRRSNLIRKAPPTEPDKNGKRQKSWALENEEPCSTTAETEEYQSVNQYHPKKVQTSSIQRHQQSIPQPSPSAGISPGTGQTLFHQHSLPGLSQDLPNPASRPPAPELTTTGQDGEHQKTQATAHSVAPWAPSLANTPIMALSGMAASVDTVQPNKVGSTPLGQSHHETSSATRDGFSAAFSNEPTTSSTSSTTNRQLDKRPEIQPSPVALIRPSITMEGSVSNQSCQTTLVKPMRILIWVRATVQPPVRWLNWDSPKPFLKHSVAQLFATVMIHGVVCNKNINCIGISLELPELDEPMMPPYHYEFKVRRNDTEEKFQLMKDFMARTVEERNRLIKLKRRGVEGGPRTGKKPDIGMVMLRPFVTKETENSPMAAGNDEECMF